jgi:Xaa-Pro dipeptidase
MATQQERERRHSCIQAAMRGEGLDALLICANGPSGRGRISYLADCYLTGGQALLIFPLAGEPVLVQPAYVGIAWAMGTTCIRDHRSSTNPAQTAAAVLADLGLDRGSIGLVDMESGLAAGNLRILERALPQAQWHDATMLFDRVRIVKSEEELGYVRETSAIVKKAFQVISGLLRPGMSERHILAEAERALYMHGVIDGFAHITRSSGVHTLHPPTDDPISPDDVVCIDLEYIGPHGYGLELGAHYSFRPPSEKIRRIFEVQCEVYERCVEAIKPGVASSEILSVANRAYRKHGFFAAGPTGLGPVQFHAHGIGLDSEEPPLVPGLEVVFEPGMVLSLHPHLGPEDPGRPVIWINDNVLVTATGAERLSYPHTEWTVL